MTFVWIQMLWLLAIVPVLVAAYLLILRRKKRLALRYANLPMVKQAMGGSGRYRRHISPILSLIAITILIVAIARPMVTISLASQKATIMLSMDVSGSMRMNDVSPSRIEASQAAAKAFIKDQPREVRVGIVAFAGSALLVQPPTTSHDDLNNAIDRFELQPRTAVGSGILVSLATLFPDEKIDTNGPEGGFTGGGLSGPPETGVALGSRSNSQTAQKPHQGVPPGSYNAAAIILLTDGATNAGPDPEYAARIAADHGVRVFTVGFGSAPGAAAGGGSGGGPGPGGGGSFGGGFGGGGFGGGFFRSQLDEDALKRIADITRGQYYRATSESDLRKIYAALNTKRIVEVKQTEIGAFLAAAAAAFAVLSAMLSLIWFNRTL